MSAWPFMSRFSSKWAPNQLQKMSIGRCHWRSECQHRYELWDSDSAAQQPLRDVTKRNACGDMVPTAAPAAGTAGCDHDAALSGSPQRTWHSRWWSRCRSERLPAAQQRCGFVDVRRAVYRNATNTQQPRITTNRTHNATNIQLMATNRPLIDH